MFFRILPGRPRSRESAIIPSARPGVLPLLISRTVSVSPPMITFGETSSETVPSQVVRSFARTAGWPLMKTLLEPSARYCGPECFSHATLSSSSGEVPAAAESTLGCHISLPNCPAAESSMPA